MKIEYLPKIFKENICSLSEVVDSDKFSNTIVWFKFRYINEQEEELMLRIGHSDPIRIWINEEPFILLEVSILLFLIMMLLFIQMKKH